MDARKTVSWLSTHDGRIGELVNLHTWAVLEEDERDPQAAIPVMLTLARTERGRWVCTGLIVGDLLQTNAWRPREVNAATLRDIHIPDLISRALRTADLPDEFGAWIGERLDEAPTSATRPGRGGYPESHYEEVAALYRRAQAESPHAPTKWLAERKFTSLPTARRWIAGARSRGLLDDQGIEGDEDS